MLSITLSVEMRGISRSAQKEGGVAAYKLPTYPPSRLIRPQVKLRFGNIPAVKQTLLRADTGLPQDGPWGFSPSRRSLSTCWSLSRGWQSRQCYSHRAESTASLEDDIQRCFKPDARTLITGSAGVTGDSGQLPRRGYLPFPPIPFSVRCSLGSSPRCSSVPGLIFLPPITQMTTRVMVLRSNQPFHHLLCAWLPAKYSTQ